MRFLGLNHGAADFIKADFILTPDGHHVFLEVNLMGEFFWQEKHRGLPLSGVIAHLLVSNQRAR